MHRECVNIIKGYINRIQAQFFVRVSKNINRLANLGEMPLGVSAKTDKTTLGARGLHPERSKYA